MLIVATVVKNFGLRIANCEIKQRAKGEVRGQKSEVRIKNCESRIANCES